MLPPVTYTPYDTYSKEKTGDLITFAQFEEENVLSETRNDAESGDKSDEDPIIPPLIIQEKLMRWILAMIHMMNLCLRRF